ncbi:MAG: hypothetical protein JWM64_2652 [Frankiales bacterium]|nr:hypothetical protein [Frankiales bacterium]
MLSKRVRRGDDGVVAVLTALLVCFVLLPVAALGLTAYTRSGVAEEMQRAADSGALAGAASLALLDVDTLLGNGLVNELLPLPETALPVLGSTGRACTSALAARGTTSTSPLAQAFASPPTCAAVYTPDPVFSSCTAGLATAVTTLTGPVTDRLTSLLGGLLAPLIGTQITSAIDVTNAVDRLVPALAHNGVRVTLGYSVNGPLDALLPGASSPTSSVATADARRQFKALLPDVAQLGTLLGAPLLTAPLNAVGTALSPTEKLVVTTLQLVLNALRYLVGQKTVAELASYLDGTLGVINGQLSSLVTGLTSLLLGPLTAPVTVPTVTKPVGTCLLATQDLIDDLSNALQINPDGRTDLVACLSKEVLGLPGLTTVPVTQTCVNRLFRAQLAK